MLKLEVLTKKQKELSGLVADFKDSYYLVGGTALALQWGHRRSVDYDLFTKNQFERDRVKAKVGENRQIGQVLVSSKGELTMMVEGVKMSWYRYDYKIPLSVEWEGIIKMPESLVICAMKAFAMGRRAKWKDYVDLYFGFKRFDLGQVVGKAEGLFGEGLFDERLLREQLVYYEDVDYSEKVEYMPGFEVEKGEVKDFLREVATR